MVRYNTDGSLDSSFDTDGKLTTDFGGDDTGASVTVQADGKILLAGTSNGNFALVRYNANGSLDSSFDTDGKVTTDFGGSDTGASVTLQADGKILLAGSSDENFALARYNTDGSLDSSFDTDGKVTTDFGDSLDTGASVTLQADGKILLAGTSNGNFALARYNSNGSVDNSFSSPISTLNNTSSYIEPDYYWNNFPVVLDSHVRIIDAQLSVSASYNGATLSLSRHTSTNAQDVFSGAGTLSALITGAYFSVDSITIGRVTANTGGVLTLAFNSNAAEILVNKAMQQIAYSNTSNTPPASVQIDWTFNDGNTGSQGTGGGLSVTGATTVNITPINDAPVSAYTLVDQTLLANIPFVYSFPTGAFIDPDLDILTYSVLMVNGSGVPPWLSINTSNGTLSGTPDPLDVGIWNLGITARDPSGNRAYDEVAFTLSVTSNTINGTSGNDSLDGGTGDDNMLGGDGNDLYYVREIGDSVTELNADLSSGGIDTVYSYLANYTLSSNVENGRVMNAAAANLVGNSLNNMLYGGKGNNVLNGLAGNDTLDGGTGDDATLGGDGDDLYYVRETGDSVTELNADLSSGGNDTVYSYLANYTLSSNVENGRVMNAAAANLVGNSLNNMLYGGKGNNVLDGGAGNDTVSYFYASAAVTANLATSAAQDTKASGMDTFRNIENLIGSPYNDTLIGNVAANVLNGGSGNDNLTGGAGLDTFTVASGTDTITDLGNGVDILTVASTATANATLAAAWTATAATTNSGTANITTSGLAVNLAAVTTGTVGYKVTNTGIATTLTGSSFTDTLIGGAGNDKLVGGLGNDNLIGGAGLDTFTVASGTDTITDLGNGVDILTVVSTATANATLAAAWTATVATTNSGTANITTSGLAVNLAAVTTGTVGYKVTNTGIATTLTGSSFTDTLIGGAGNDKLVGGLGNDTLIGVGGNDLLTGGAESDIFSFSIAANTNTNKDTLTDFVSGTDSLQFSKAVFAGISTVAGVGAGTVLATSEFVSSSTATSGTTTTSHFIYNTTSGILYYDADANVAGAAVQVALIGTSTHPSLSFADFHVVA